MRHDTQQIRRWNEKLQALKVLKQATQFLKEHGALTQPAQKQFCAIALALVLDGGDREADEDWDDLLAAADGAEVQVVLVEDDGCLAGLWRTEGMDVPRAATSSQPKEKQCQYKVSLSRA